MQEAARHQLLPIPQHFVDQERQERKAVLFQKKKRMSLTVAMSFWNCSLSRYLTGKKMSAKWISLCSGRERRGEEKRRERDERREGGGGGERERVCVCEERRGEETRREEKKQKQKKKKKKKRKKKKKKKK